MPKKKAPPKPALDPSFSAKKPISAWNRPLQLDTKGLFGALAKGTLHGFTGQWTELGGDAVNGMAALGLDSHDAPHLSWLLLRRALLSAMAELIRESLPAAEEYFARALEAPRDARKAELIDGALILFPSPLDVHERLHGFLFHLIREYVDRFDLGEVRGSRSAVKLADDQIYQPDIMFVSRDRISLFERQGIFGAPDLVVEILSVSTASYDRGPKLRAYERTGVREVWLVDATGPRGTEILERHGLRLQPVTPEDGMVPSLALPGFRLRLA